MVQKKYFTVEEIEAGGYKRGQPITVYLRPLERCSVAIEVTHLMELGRHNIHRMGYHLDARDVIDDNYHFYFLPEDRYNLKKVARKKLNILNNIINETLLKYYSDQMHNIIWHQSSAEFLQEMLDSPYGYGCPLILNDGLRGEIFRENCALYIPYIAAGRVGPEPVLRRY